MERINRKNQDDEALFEPETDKDPRRDWVNENVSRAAVWLFLLSLAAAVLSAAFIFGSLARDLSRVSGTAAEFFSKYLSFDADTLARRSESYFEAYSDKDSTVLQLVSPDGTVLCSSSAGDAGRRIDEPDVGRAAQKHGSSIRIGRDSHTRGFIVSCSSAVVSTDGEVPGVVRAVSGLDRAFSSLLKALLIIAAMFALGVVCVTLTTRRFSRRVMAPISRVNETAQLIAEGLYGVHIEPVYPGEIGQLCRTVNEMSDAIGRS